MTFLEKISLKARNPLTVSPVRLAALGDSVTQGCFELVQLPGQIIDTVFEPSEAYHQVLGRLLEDIFPRVPVNVINAGISGDNAQQGLERLERDVLGCSPDLVIICFGLNDVLFGEERKAAYQEALREMFRRLRQAQTETIFMTPNMMNTYVCADYTLTPEMRQIAEKTADIQTGGLMGAYMEAARKVCQEENIPVCDCYALWRKMEKLGTDTTMLLSNRINHPTRGMHRIMAQELFHTILHMG